MYYKGKVMKGDAGVKPPDVACPVDALMNVNMDLFHDL